MDITIYDKDWYDVMFGLLIGMLCCFDDYVMDQGGSSWSHGHRYAYAVHPCHDMGVMCAMRFSILQ